MSWEVIKAWLIEKTLWALCAYVKYFVAMFTGWAIVMLLSIYVIMPWSDKRKSKKMRESQTIGGDDDEK